MKDLINIIIVFVIIYSIFSPLFKSKKKVNIPLPGNDYDRDDTIDETLPEERKYRPVEDGDLLAEAERILRGDRMAFPSDFRRQTPPVEITVAREPVAAPAIQVQEVRVEAPKVVSTIPEAEHSDYDRQNDFIKNIRLAFKDKSRVREAFIYSEILSKPKGLRR